MHFYEIFYGSVIRLFKLGVEETGGQLPAFTVIMQAFAAFMFAAAGLICTVTHSFVLFH